MAVVLYTLDCPKCRILEEKLRKKNISFEKSRDMTMVTALGFTSVPILEVDNTYMEFDNAIKWLSEQEENNEIQ